MQRTLGKLVAWANRWDMDFSVNKCIVMHIGRRGHSKTVGEIMQCVYAEKKKFLGIVEHPIVPCCKGMRDINEHTSYREINILNTSGKM